jgi:hypothetical protein
LGLFFEGFVSYFPIWWYNSLNRFQMGPFAAKWLNKKMLPPNWGQHLFY